MTDVSNLGTSVFVSSISIEEVVLQFGYRTVTLLLRTNPHCSLRNVGVWKRENEYDEKTFSYSYDDCWVPWDDSRTCFSRWDSSQCRHWIAGNPAQMISTQSKNMRFNTTVRQLTSRKAPAKQLGFGFSAIQARPKPLWSRYHDPAWLGLAPGRKSTKEKVLARLVRYSTDLLTRTPVQSGDSCWRCFQHHRVTGMEDLLRWSIFRSWAFTGSWIEMIGHVDYIPLQCAVVLYQWEPLVMIRMTHSDADLKQKI